MCANKQIVPLAGLKVPVAGVKIPEPGQPSRLPQVNGPMLMTHDSPECLTLGWFAGFQQAPPAQEVYGAYRQRQAQLRPPAMPTSVPLPPPPQPGPSHAASYGSDYGSLDRSSVSGSEATSPVKSMEVCGLYTSPFLTVVCISSGLQVRDSLRLKLRDIKTCQSCSLCRQDFCAD